MNAQPKILSVSLKLNAEPFFFVSIQVCRFFQRLSTLLQLTNICVIVSQHLSQNQQISQLDCLIICKTSCVPIILWMILYWNCMNLCHGQLCLKLFNFWHHFCSQSEGPHVTVIENMVQIFSTF